MDFQTLLAQIGELEENNRVERSKLMEEVARHNSTQTELDRGTSLNYHSSHSKQ